MIFKAAAGCSLAVAIGAGIFRRHQLETHKVATNLFKYLRLRYTLSNAGWGRLLLLADFDRTLTTASCGVSCHGVVESCQELSRDYREATKVLFEKYYPIETSATMTREEKIPLMTEWYTRAHELLLKEPFTPELLDATAAKSAIALRPGCDELFALCHDKATPLVVCSAGLGNVVQACLKHRLQDERAVAALPQLPVVSNWLRFDDAGVVNGFSQPLLHMFNKDGAFVKSQIGDSRWNALSTGRSVCLVLGDGLGDAAMADGLGLTNVVKIGFLNETDPARVAARLPAFEDAFDIVLLGDQSFEYVLKMLRGLK